MTFGLLSKQLFFLVLLFIPLIFFAACTPSESRNEITVVHQKSGTGISPTLPVSTEERFGATQSTAHEQVHKTDAPHWKTPENWTEVPATSMRIANFRIGEGGAAECYMSILRGGAGGVMANINRWREQMGAAPFSESEIADLPNLPALGGSAVFVDIEGAYTGMDGGTKSAYRLLGLVLERENDTLFVKMVGPADIVAAEREHFEQFCKSLH